MTVENKISLEKLIFLFFHHCHFPVSELISLEWESLGLSV